VTTATSTARREELARFLRSRRERLTPADVGLPPGIRRRTPGLRREEVAQLAGVGVTWYTWLEQGRPINASVQILDAVARTLRLDHAEREHLYRLADVPSVPDGDGPAVLPAEIQTILDALAPNPAVIYNARYDVLAWNRGYAALLPAVVAAPAADRNVLLQMVTVPACCSCLVDWEGELGQIVATFRAAFSRHLDEPAWTALVRRLSAASPEFTRLWAAHEVAMPGPRRKTFQHVDGDGLLHTRATSLAVSALPETRIVVYTPIDEPDRQLLERVVAGPPTVRLCPRHRALDGVGQEPRLGALTSPRD
jgi:transcriptional regulator with XRE-family HTH domain